MANGTKRTNTEVLIVGAGPVGLTLAAELTRYGVSVRIIDKNLARTDKSKAIVLWSRTLELLDRTGQTDKFLSAGLKVAGVSILAHNKPLAHAELTGLPSPYPFALMIPQSDTERVLEEYLANMGVKVERNAEMVDFKETSHGVTSTLRHQDGGTEDVESLWLGGCDGAHSTVRHKLGKQFRGEKRTDTWVLGDMHFKGYAGPLEITIAWHAKGVLAIFPIGASRYRIIASSDEAGDTGDTGDEPTEHPEPTLEVFQQILDQRGVGGITVYDPVWLSSFSINERKVEDYRQGRAFLAGDGAHVHSPAGGQGMNTGMQDAVNLAWKVALVIKGSSPQEPLLGSYSTERSAVAKLVLEMTSKATSVAVLKGGVKQAIRNHIFSLVFGLHAVQEEVPKLLSELAVAYHESPLSTKRSALHGGPAAGERAPVTETNNPVGAGNSPRFALFADSGAEASALIAKHPNLFEPQPRPPYVAGGLWIVRPDGYVGFSGSSTDFSAAADYMSKFILA
jgi:2-polyprenyl-6-methoxyphenol hydroxylase-like FAD-dependent oxidoreductase